MTTVAPSVTFNSPRGIATNAGGTILFLADTGSHQIRKITVSTGVVVTLAGTSGTSGSADGYGESASFKSPYGVACLTDATYVFVADTGNSRRTGGWPQSSKRGFVTSGLFWQSR